MIPYDSVSDVLLFLHDNTYRSTANFALEWYVHIGTWSPHILPD
jgi:hypothetical protein